VAAQVQTLAGPLWISSVHLSLSTGANRGQIQRLDDWAAARAKFAPVLVGGDFNAREGSMGIRAMANRWQDIYRHLNPSTEGATHEVRWPWGGTILRQRLDYLFLRRGLHSWRAVDARLIRPEGKRGSDHEFVLARLRR
jgi:endonuclease/exonuclease/phosphatase family metal-dependent hydrolase